MRPEITALFFLIFCLCCGFLAGAWWTEREYRKKKQADEVGRINLSMPAKAKDARVMLGLLRGLMEQAEREGLFK